MGKLLDKLKRKRNDMLLQTVQAKIAERLYKFQQGFPLGTDEKEVVFMLSPEKKDLNVFIVALNEKAEIKRMVAKYTASELVARLGDRLQEEGLNLSDIPMPGIDNEKGENDE